MSIYKRCSSTDRRIARIRERVAYVFDETKTRSELCHVYGVSKENVFEDMLFVKQLYCKTEGRQYLHWVLSHDDGVSTEVADSVGQEVLGLLEGNYQAIEATHTNTSNVHTHYLINPVNIKTGKKFTESLADMQRFRDRINDILVQYALSPIEKVTDTDEDVLDKSEFHCLYDESRLAMDDILESTFFDDDVQEDFGKSCPVLDGADLGVLNTDEPRYIRGIIYDDPEREDIVFYDPRYEEMDHIENMDTYVFQKLMYRKIPDCTFRLRSKDGFEGKGAIEAGHLLVPGLFYEGED